MNDFEQQLVDRVLDGLHEFEVKVTEELGEIRGEINAMTQKKRKRTQSTPRCRRAKHRHTA